MIYIDIFEGGEIILTEHLCVTSVTSVTLHGVRSLVVFGRWIGLGLVSFYIIYSYLIENIY